MTDLFDFTVMYAPEATPEDQDVIRAGLQTYNFPRVGEDHHHTLTFLVRNGDGDVVGGLVGDLYLNWLFIAGLWLHPMARSRGLGARLVAMAEEAAIRDGRTHAHVDTFDFQAPDFYRKLGYTLWGELGPYPNGHIRYFFQKTLVADLPSLETP